MIEKREFLNELFDLYGAMLTEKQISNFVLYYHEDFSLAEIAEEGKVSRNAIYDNLKRTESILITMEEKLGFLKKMEKITLDIQKVARTIEKLEKNKEYNQIDKVRKKIEEIADNI